MKPVKGFSMLIGQGSELLAPVRHELTSLTRPIQSESYYVVSTDESGTCVHAGPFSTEQRAFGEVSAITNTSGT